MTITLDSAAGMPSTLDFAATPSDGDAVEESGVAIILDSAAGTPPILDSAATPSEGNAVEESGVAITQEYAARTPLHWTPYQLHPMVMQ